MDEDTLADLKQFIAGQLSQQTTSLREELRTDWRADIHELGVTLSARIDDLQTSVSQAITTSNDATDTQLQDHENRITELEQQTA